MPNFIVGKVLIRVQEPHDVHVSVDGNECGEDNYKPHWPPRGCIRRWGSSGASFPISCMELWNLYSDSPPIPHLQTSPEKGDRANRNCIGRRAEELIRRGSALMTSSGKPHWEPNSWCRNDTCLRFCLGLGLFTGKLEPFSANTKCFEFLVKVVSPLVKYSYLAFLKKFSPCICTPEWEVCQFRGDLGISWQDNPCTAFASGGGGGQHYCEEITLNDIPEAGVRL